MKQIVSRYVIQGDSVYQTNAIKQSSPHTSKEIKPNTKIATQEDKSFSCKQHK
jgi:hypothetical protein